MNSSDALTRLLEEKVEFLLLQFTDILGSIKTVEIPSNKFDGALAGEVTFDGSALEGFHRTIESELLLQPDLETLRISPTVGGETRTARLICDVHNLDHTPFEGCPRTRLKLVLEQFAALKYEPWWRRRLSSSSSSATHSRSPPPIPMIPAAISTWSRSIAVRRPAGASSRSCTPPDSRSKPGTTKSPRASMNRTEGSARAGDG